MKRRDTSLRSLLSLALSLFAGVAAPELGAPPAPSDPVCGFLSGPHFYYETSEIKQGLAVELMSGPAQLHQAVTLRFFVCQRPRSFPVDRLQIEHEKFMHIIGVRDDLSEFFHIHPTRVSPGVWEVSHTFARGGKYKIWSDVKYRGVSYSFGHPLLTISGSPGGPGADLAPTNSVTRAGYQINLTHPEPLVSGRTNQFQFTIHDAAGKPEELENFLGAPMHLVLVREDLSVYLHAHPENRGGGEQTIRFRQAFAKPGTYNLFAQFRPKEAKLLADDAILAEFAIKVIP
jgi:hypothetical protein